MPPKKKDAEAPAELPIVDAPEIAPPAEPEPEEAPAEPVIVREPMHQIAIAGMMRAGLTEEQAAAAYDEIHAETVAYVESLTPADKLPAELVELADAIPVKPGAICLECFGDGWATASIADFSAVGCAHGTWSRHEKA